MTTTLPESQPFQEEVSAVLSRIRDALHTLVASLSAIPLRPQELARILDLDKSLAWKVHRIMQSNDPFAAARLVPGSAGVAILAGAVRKHCSDDLADAVADAFADFEALIERHAGDRGAFDILLSGFAPDGKRDIDVSHRKSAYLGNSAIIGLHSKFTNILTILQPASDDSRLDMVKVGVVHNLRKLRPGVPTPIWRVCHHTADRQLLPRTGEPIDPPVGVPDTDLQVPLLDRFSTELPSPLRAVAMPNGIVNIELTAGDVGDTGAVTLVIAEIYRDIAPRYASPDDRWYDIIHRPYIPTETLAQDLLIRRGTFPGVAPELGVYQMFDPALDLGAPLPEHCRLPIAAGVELVGAGPAFFRSQDLLFYPELLSYIFQKIGWEPKNFELYRVRTPYPIQPSAFRIRLQYPDPPQQTQKS